MRKKNSRKTGEEHIGENSRTTGEDTGEKTGEETNRRG